MNYEEKYNEALKVIEGLYNVVRYQSSTDALLASQTIEKAFPELKESEDERIRKWLINLLSKMQYHHCDDEMEMGNKAITWLEKQGEQNPSWSEEDEKMISFLIKIFEVNHHNEHFKVNPIGTTDMEVISTKEIVDWLKSIKPNHWKPSEEQMEALKKRTHGLHTSSETRKALESLINDLEKL